MRTFLCCPYCRDWFFPSIYHPQQVVCNRSGCQRRRKREYHRWKLKTDAIYRQVVRDSQKQWWAEQRFAFTSIPNNIAQ